MNDRERLIKLFLQPMYVAGFYDKETVAKAYADRILADGWIRPPCKPGDTVYCVRSWPSGRKTIHKFEAPDWDWIMEHYNDFGKTVFLTREEAEKALAERTGNK